MWRGPNPTKKNAHHQQTPQQPQPSRPYRLPAATAAAVTRATTSAGSKRITRHQRHCIAVKMICAYRRHFGTDGVRQITLSLRAARTQIVHTRMIQERIESNAPLATPQQHFDESIIITLRASRGKKLCMFRPNKKHVKIANSTAIPDNGFSSHLSVCWSHK